MSILSDVYVDYSENPTVDICLNCTRSNCIGDCARVRAALRAARPSEKERKEKNDKARALAAKYNRSIGRIRELLCAGMSIEEIDTYFAVRREIEPAVGLALETVRRLAVTYGVNPNTIRHHAKRGRSEEDIRAYYATHLPKIA